MPSVCGKQWDNVISPGIMAEDEIEIHLHNPHAYGNKSAYRDFLNTLCNSDNSSDILEKYLEPYCKPFRTAGGMIMVIALMILGAAMASMVLRDPVGGILWKFGLLSAFAGGFIALDTMDFSFSKGLLVFNTYGRQICMMFFVLWLGLCAVESLSGRGKKVAEIALAASAAFDGILILLSFTGVMVIYDTGIYWVIFQVILCPLMLCCCVCEYLHANKGKRIFLVSYMLLFVTVLLDIAGIGASEYSYGTCTKLVFVLLFILHIVRAVVHIVINRQAADRAQKLEKELENSRISLMISQMQPHFLYNVLNTIYHLCGREPETAQEAISTFSDYLRNNMGALEKKELVPFDEELRHIKTYLQLEKIRFGDELAIEYDIEVTNFFLPVLTVQPLVENAVEHGIGKKTWWRNGKNFHKGICRLF